MPRKPLAKIPAWWLADCAEWAAAQRLSHGEIGRRIAKAMRRPSGPYSQASISRYLGGLLNSVEITEAFAVARSAPSPLVFADTKDIAEWCHLGERLREARPDLFQSLLVQVRAVSVS